MFAIFGIHYNTRTMEINWNKELNAAITVCDKEGIIIYMNDRAVSDFIEYGGIKLIGTNVLDCHPEPSRIQLENILRNEKTDIYTTTKEGIKKLVYQAPWYKNHKYMGIVELSFEIPSDIKNIER